MEELKEFLTCFRILGFSFKSIGALYCVHSSTVRKVLKGDITRSLKILRTHRKIEQGELKVEGSEILSLIREFFRIRQEIERREKERRERERGERERRERERQEREREIEEREIEEREREEREREERERLEREEKEREIDQPTPESTIIGVIGRGIKGIHFDNFTLQSITKCRPAPLTPSQQEHNQLSTKFQELQNQITSYLPFFYKPFEKMYLASEADILFIPGKTRTGNNEQREIFENEIIKNALNNGQPIMAVCGGHWQLAKALRARDIRSKVGDKIANFKIDNCKNPALQILNDFEITSQEELNQKGTSELDHWLSPQCLEIIGNGFLNSNQFINDLKSLRNETTTELFKSVKNHSARRMMNISKNGKRVTYNIQMHGLSLVKGTHLQEMMEEWNSSTNEFIPLDKIFTVNSVHWLAVNQAPAGTTTSAYSCHSDLIKNTKKENHDECVESISSTFGVPIIGTQWHPEASANNEKAIDKPNCRLINKMVKQCGFAFKVKRIAHKLLKDRKPILI